jgi:dolichol-phosphate mannosyltransferase
VESTVDTLVVVATYNECESLPTLLEAILAQSPNYGVLVVDDSSPDGTGVLVRAHSLYGQRVLLIERPGKQGYGSAIVAGFREALALKVPVVATMDADLSHDPAALPTLRAQLEAGEVVLGSRYTRGGRVENWSPYRRLLSLGANHYVRSILGLPYHDCTSGFRMYRCAVLAAVDWNRFHTTGYAFLSNLLYLLHCAGRRIVEAPITYHERREGQSKMSWGVIGEAVLAPWKARLQGRF